MKNRTKKIINGIEVLLKTYMRIFFMFILIQISLEYMDYSNMYLIEKLILVASIFYFIAIPVIQEIKYKDY